MTVSQLNEAAKNLLEIQFGDVEVGGEISRLVKHSSGHWYFALKDEKSVIQAAMFKGDNAKVNFNPKDGDKVSVIGKITIFPPTGSYQIVIKKMLPQGVGEMELAFKALKEKLQKEGLFDEIHKKPLPNFPKQVAIITSTTSAAYQDMINRIKQSGYFLCKFSVFNSLMQGENAPQSIISAIKKADNMGFCAIIIARGGGSKEDLWCFNDESLARAIYHAKTPIISAIGHEIDYSISDFVADHRSITPTASIDDLLPNADEIRQKFDLNLINLQNFINNKINLAQICLKNSSLNLKSRAVTQQLNLADERLQKFSLSYKSTINQIFAKFNAILDKNQAILHKQDQFFKITKDLVNLQKDGKKITLEELKDGDLINLISQNSNKFAKILS